MIYSSQKFCSWYVHTYTSWKALQCRYSFIYRTTGAKEHLTEKKRLLLSEGNKEQRLLQQRTTILSSCVSCSFNIHDTVFPFFLALIMTGWHGSDTKFIHIDSNVWLLGQLFLAVYIAVLSHKTTRILPSQPRPWFPSPVTCELWVLPYRCPQPWLTSSAEQAFISLKVMRFGGAVRRKTDRSYNKLDEYSSGSHRC